MTQPDPPKTKEESHADTPPPPEGNNTLVPTVPPHAPVEVTRPPPVVTSKKKKKNWPVLSSVCLLFVSVLANGWVVRVNSHSHIRLVTANKRREEAKKGAGGKAAADEHVGQR